MGRDSREWSIKVHWTVSRHNSDNDKIDDGLEEELRWELDDIVTQVEAIVERPEYKRLGAFVT